MSSDVIDEELERYRSHALEFAELLKAGLDASALVERVLASRDDLVSLAEEAPDDRRPEIQYLIDRFEALQRRLAN